MSTSAVSTSSLNQQLQQYFQTRQSDLQELGQALNSGDLAGAQTAYNSIVSLGQGGPFASGNPFRANQREQDFAAVGQALQSGDLAGAQHAFSALAGRSRNGAQQQVDPLPPKLSASPVSASPVTASAGPEIIINLSSAATSSVATTGTTTGAQADPVPSQLSASPASASAGPEIVLNLSSGANSATPEEITINISNPTNGGGEQVSLSIGNQGSNAQQITFNLNANSNEQIILNLLGASSSTSSSASSSSSSSSGGLNVTA